MSPGVGSIAQGIGGIAGYFIDEGADRSLRNRGVFDATQRERAQIAKDDASYGGSGNAALRERARMTLGIKRVDEDVVGGPGGMQLQNALNMSESAARGELPSVAENQFGANRAQIDAGYNQAQAQTIANAAAVAGAQRGGGASEAVRQATNNAVLQSNALGAQRQGALEQANFQAAGLRAGEMAQARGQFADQASGLNQQRLALGQSREGLLQNLNQTQGQLRGTAAINQGQLDNSAMAQQAQLAEANKDRNVQRYAKKAESGKGLFGSALSLAGGIATLGMGLSYAKDQS